MSNCDLSIQSNSHPEPNLADIGPCVSFYILGRVSRAMMRMHNADVWFPNNNCCSLQSPNCSLCSGKLRRQLLRMTMEKRESVSLVLAGRAGAGINNLQVAPECHRALLLVNTTASFRKAHKISAIHCSAPPLVVSQLLHSA